MCEKLRVTNTSILLRLLLIVGLVVSPLVPRVLAAGDHSMTMSGTELAADEASPQAGVDNAMLPCHDGKMDCDKTDCDKTCMAACMSLSVQCLPSIASTLARVVVVAQRFAIRSEAQLASLAAQPPARPPRA
jgi:hypothetical protein